MQSPCTQLCMIDPATGWCLGCARSLGEIAEWGGADEARQREILAALPERRRALENRPPA